MLVLPNTLVLSIGHRKNQLYIRRLSAYQLLNKLLHHQRAVHFLKGLILPPAEFLQQQITKIKLREKFRQAQNFLCLAKWLWEIEILRLALEGRKMCNFSLTLAVVPGLFRLTTSWFAEASITIFRKSKWERGDGNKGINFDCYRKFVVKNFIWSEIYIGSENLQQKFRFSLFRKTSIKFPMHNQFLVLRPPWMWFLTALHSPQVFVEG